MNKKKLTYGQLAKYLHKAIRKNPRVAKQKVIAFDSNLGFLGVGDVHTEEDNQTTLPDGQVYLVMS
jgi:hypothetical protein